MKSSDHRINRRQALSQLGGAMLGSAFLPQMALGQGMPAASPSAEKQSKSQGAKPGKKPNILWITTEGVPTAVLSCYGSKLIETPNIDRIAKGGMRFENSFVTNALCAPSRATLLTGKYSHLNGVLGNPGEPAPGTERTHFDPAQETIAKILKRDGYQTGIVGKWHLPVNPGDVGFDYFVFKNGAGGPYYQAEGYRRNMTLGSTEIVDKTYPGYITENEVNFVIEGLEKFHQPFFMMYQPFSDHRPFQPPHKYEHLYDDVRIPEPGTFYDDYTLRSSAARDARMEFADMPDFNPSPDLTERQRKQWNYQQFMRHFLGTLRAQDDGIGRLLDYLDKHGLSENTIVIFTGDHGFFLGDHGWFDKRFMYEQAIRVPWMIRYPGVVTPGSTSKDWVVNIDNAPTVLDIVGLSVPEDMQGRSLVPLFHGTGAGTGTAPPDWQTSFYYHNYEFGPPHWVQPFYGVRTERYKLIWYYNLNEWEFFDLEKDPDEMDSLFGTAGYKLNPAYQSAFEDTLAELKRLREKFKDNTGPPVKVFPAKYYD